MRNELRGWLEALTTRDVVSALVGRLLLAVLVAGLIVAGTIYAGPTWTIAAVLVATLAASLVQLRRRGSL